MTLAIDRPQATQAVVKTVKTRALSNNERSIVIEKTCDSSLEAGECFFCTGPETD